ncbi:hypothetical protein [Prochlorococcus marinus]|uniref:hypothetical protein n=1 Tax=Prochlorococcus marinus TaxID=1219 RepID=UPI0022B36E6E|nr:hypothetical protein [Prochlorococcus marinus]
MKAILIISIILLTYSGTANSYPKSQMDDCVSSALSNPATKSISEIAIKNYCDCALKAIIDENKDIRESGYKCAQENFN